MEEINEIISKNDLFSKIKLESIIINGGIISKKCRDVIISLSNLKNIFPISSENIPILSIFQSFMVKEIGSGFDIVIPVIFLSDIWLFVAMEEKWYLVLSYQISEQII